VKPTYLGNKRGWYLYDMGGYIRAWDYFDRWGPLRYDDETVEQAAERNLKERKWVKDATGQWWLVEHGYVEAHPKVVEKLIYEGVPGMVHVILFNGERWGYLPYPPRRGFEPDDVMLREGEDPKEWRVPIPDDLRPEPSDIEAAKELYRYLRERHR